MEDEKMITGQGRERGRKGIGRDASEIEEDERDAGLYEKRSPIKAREKVKAKEERRGESEGEREGEREGRAKE